MSGTKRSKINHSQKTMKYKTNEQNSAWYKIFELKYGNGKLSKLWKYNQVRLVLAVLLQYVCNKKNLLDAVNN